jgi:hypothetical protein
MEKGFSHGIIFIVLVEIRIFEEHLFEGAFVFDREFTLRGLVVALLVNNSIDDVEEHFFIWLNSL